MDDQPRDQAPERDPIPGPERDTDDDLEGHSATIYRRRRGPYPLRHGASLPEADDRTRSERDLHHRRAAS